MSTATNTSVALSGNMLAIGAPRAQRIKAGEADAPLPSGELYLFERDGERWVQTSVLAAPVPRQSDRFGSSIVLTPSLLAVSAVGDASAARGSGKATSMTAARLAQVQSICTHGNPASPRAPRS